MADAEVKLILKAVDNASQTVDSVGGKLRGLGDTFEALTGFSLGGAAAVGGLVSALRFSVQAAADAQRVQSQLNAVIKSTGGAAGLTADQINDMAARLEDLTAVDGDVITGASSILLTFTKIGQETFPRAMEAALDLSAAFGQDLQSSVMQLGKALNDPIAGVGALQRVGVSFTAEQKDMIEALVEANDVLGAQAIILSELETQVGGTAAAYGQTFAGQMDRFSNAVGMAGEAIGNIFLPRLTEALEGLNWLLLFNPRVDRALADNAKQIIETASSYEVYKLRALDAAVAAGRLKDAESESWRQAELTQDAVELLAREGVPILTREQYNATVAAQQHTQALAEETVELDNVEQAASEAAIAVKDYGSELKDLQQMIRGDVGRANEEYRQSLQGLQGELGTVADRIQELTDKRKSQGGWLNSKDAQEVSSLTGRFQELTTEIGNVEEAHKRASAQMAFDLLVQRAAIDGISEAEFNFLTKFAEGLGLVDEQTANAMVQAGEAIDLLNEDSLIPATVQAQALVNTLLGLPADITTTINVGVSGPGAGLVTGGTGGGIGAGIEARANGGPVVAGQPYLVGEQGPEMFVPSQGGRVIDARTTQIYRAAPDVNINMATGDPMDAARLMAREITRRM